MRGNAEGSTALAPCPFCGDKRVHMEKVGNVDEETLAYFATCQGCFTFGPNKRSAVRAADAWSMGVVREDYETECTRLMARLSDFAIQANPSMYKMIEVAREALELMAKRHTSRRLNDEADGPLGDELLSRANAPRRTNAKPHIVGRGVGSAGSAGLCTPKAQDDMGVNAGDGGGRTTLR